MKPYFILAFSMLLLASCAKGPSQNQYMAGEVGISRIVEFGTIITARQIGITGKNSGTGALVGAGIGAGAGSYVHGDGQGWAVAGGLLAGAVAGAAAEQAAADRQGMEYVVTTEKGVTKTVVQNMEKGDVILRPGDRVMVQTSGSYQRVLPASAMPTSIKRPKGIKVVD